MEPVYLFDLATRHSNWLSVRQATVSQNIANADTPGFASKDVEGFSDILDQTSLRMAATSAGHIGHTGGAVDAVEVRNEESWEVFDSENSVSLEQELIKAGQVSRAHNLNTSITSSFHGFVLASLGK